uniref:Putative ixodes 8-cys protein n=1 Tax=Ixodes ricinus TaxID=34613 RepID=A0A0K8R4D5_IXORI
MKVVCILLLFVIATEAESIDKKTAVKESKGENNGNQIKFKFPPYISDHKAFALSLLKICTNYSPESRKANDQQTTRAPRINDLKVDFKNCTFLCKRESGDVTLKLPEETPCGPNNQTCKNKDECVGYIPGC